jgi:ATP-dependent RNA/DNA helicase IGHMBP2
MPQVPGRAQAKSERGVAGRRRGRYKRRMADRIEAEIQRFQRLLSMELEAGRAQFDAARSGLSGAAREAAGLAVGGLVVQDTGAGALGRAAWVLVPKAGELRHGVSSGDPVRVYRRRAPEVSVRALVSRRTRKALTLVFDEAPDPSLEDGELVVEREFDETSHQRLVSGLTQLQLGKGRVATWRELLFAGRAPEFDKVRPYEDARLNEVQRRAVAQALSAVDCALVHGPPGTGKTEVLAAIAAAEVARGGTVLACAASNAAVDNLVLRLAGRGLDPVRMGHPARVHADVVDRTLEARATSHEKAVIADGLVKEARDLLRRADRASKQGRASDRYAEAREARGEAKRLFAEARQLARAAETEVLDRARVVSATLTGLDRLGERRFTLCVIDEATQATLPATVLALLRADRAVFAGDQHQLPPTVISPEAGQGGLSTTAYERLLAQHGEKVSTMLEVQHRMSVEIMAYPNASLYGGRLAAHESVARHRLGAFAPVSFVDSAGKGWSDEQPPESESRRNPGEAERVVREVRALMASGVAVRDIAVIAPYAAQVQLLRSMLPEDELEIDTVDAFQGREKEAVVVSLVRSNEACELGFTADVRRINVAITRARRRLFVVGDSATLSSHPYHEGLVRHAQETGAYVSAWEEPES